MTSMDFMTGCDTKVAGLDARVTRCGYTGEDGFEISVAEKDAVPLMEALMAEEGVNPCGLGARDSLAWRQVSACTETISTKLLAPSRVVSPGALEGQRLVAAKRTGFFRC